MPTPPVTSPIEGPTPCDVAQCDSDASIRLWSDMVPGMNRELCGVHYRLVILQRSEIPSAEPSPPLPVFESMHGDRTIDFEGQ